DDRLRAILGAANTSDFYATRPPTLVREALSPSSSLTVPMSANPPKPHGKRTDLLCTDHLRRVSRRVFPDLPFSTLSLLGFAPHLYAPPSPEMVAVPHSQAWRRGVVDDSADPGGDHSTCCLHHYQAGWGSKGDGVDSDWLS